MDALTLPSFVVSELFFPENYTGCDCYEYLKSRGKIIRYDDLDIYDNHYVYIYTKLSI